MSFDAAFLFAYASCILQRKGPHEVEVEGLSMKTHTFLEVFTHLPGLLAKEAIRLEAAHASTPVNTVLRDEAIQRIQHLTEFIATELTKISVQINALLPAEASA